MLSSTNVRRVIGEAVGPARQNARPRTSFSPSTGGVSASMVRRLFPLVIDAGEDVGQFCEEAGVSMAELAQPSARVSYAVVDALVERLASLRGAGGLGLDLAKVKSDESYGVAGLLLLTGANLWEGFSRSLAYQRLWADGERFTMSRVEGEVVLRFHHPGLSPVAAAVLSECATSEIMMAVQTLGSPDAHALRVQYMHACLGDDARLQQHFNAPLSYGAQQCSLSFASEVFLAPARGALGLLGQAIEQQCKQLVAELPGPFGLEARLRTFLEAELHAAPSLGRAAKAFKLSARSLQRRLAAEGTGFYELLDHVRREAASEMLARGMALKEIAYRLGFSDASAFLRARKRWQ